MNFLNSRMRVLIILFAGTFLISSCISNKKIVMLQKSDVNVENLPKDSIVRTYAIDTFEYKIQANDIISVRFESLTPKEYDFFAMNSQPQASANLSSGGALLMGELVDEHGEIPFPVVGKVKVAGLTIFQIQEALQKIANQYTESPIVKVRLLNYRITVLGEVVREGTVNLSNNRVSMIEAIGQAGGLGELADRQNIKLIRQRNGKIEIQYINLLQEDFVRSPYYYVYQNDVLIVPPLKQRPFRKYFGPNLALVFSSVSLVLLAITLSK
jgi:polysaccharide export outer membrane protein